MYACVRFSCGLGEGDPGTGVAMSARGGDGDGGGVIPFLSMISSPIFSRGFSILDCRRILAHNEPHVPSLTLLSHGEQIRRAKRLIYKLSNQGIWSVVQWIC
jgi:hypothetical protein